ncbi:MAG: hypothetical protein ABSG91_07015 [Syntrophobacteraceae bacterium]|jgi:hypothetical protein
MPAQVDICNRSLSVIGTRSTIASMNEATPEAQACTIHFEAACRAMLRLAPWSFARSQCNGALIAAASGTPENVDGSGALPLVPWSYEYAWPQDCIRLRRVLNPYVQSQAGSVVPMWPGIVAAPPKIPAEMDNRVPYQISLDRDSAGNQIKVILSNIENALIVYTALVDNPNLWDDEFSEAFVFMLASHLVGALIGDKQMDKALYEKAAQLAVTARAVDANEQPVSPNHTPDWIRVRGYSAIPGEYPYPMDDNSHGYGYWG